MIAKLFKIWPSLSLSLCLSLGFSLALDSVASGASSTPSPTPSVSANSAVVPCKRPQLTGYDQKTARKILATAEEIRSLERAAISVDLKNEADGRTTQYDLKILRSTERRAYIEFLAPQEERGRRMLARGQSYWSTFPDSKRVVPISRREMIGNSAFAIADIFQLDADSDYDAKIVATATLNDKPVLLLELKAKHDEAPYACVEYWVTKKDSFPLKAKFYGVSGKHLKTMSIETIAKIGGRLRPSVTKMIDEAVKAHNSWWTTKSMTAANVPDMVFTQDYLRNQQ